MSTTRADLEVGSPGQGCLPRQSKLAQGWSLLLNRLRGLQTEGMESVGELGYRRYVGGYWDQVGRLQFEFLQSRGLQSNHVLLDIACGSLRGGRFFIPYL